MALAARGSAHTGSASQIRGGLTFYDPLCVSSGTGVESIGKVETAECGC